MSYDPDDLRAAAKKSLISFAAALHVDYQPNWHHRVIARAMEKMAAKEPGWDRLLISMPPRMGKQLADETPILTTKGWTTHGSLRPGDYVYGPDGLPTRVVAVSEKSFEGVDVEFTNGDVITCHPNHEWTVYDRSECAFRTVETRYIASRKYWSGPRGKRGGRGMFQLPPVDPVLFVHQDLPLHPYALGAWLGDGTSTAARIAHHRHDTEVVDYIESLGYKKSSYYVQPITNVAYTYFSGNKPNNTSLFSQALIDLGVRGNKHIPEIYLRSNINQRLFLLAGLVDTDGHVDKTGRVHFTTASEKLRDDVVDLLTTLGQNPRTILMPPRVSTSGIRGKKTIYKISFHPTLAIPTQIPRKHVHVKEERRRVSIVSIGPVKASRGHCIQVERTDGLYLAGRTLVPTHNSELTTVMFPSWYLGSHPNEKIILATYGTDLAEDMGRNARAVASQEVYQSIFETALDPHTQAITKWQLLNGGGYYATSTGAALTGKGANCLIGSTLVRTRKGSVPISEMRTHIGEAVLSKGPSGYEWQKVEAWQVRLVTLIYRIRTNVGTVIEGTPEHPLCVKGSYVPLSSLRIGDVLDAPEHPQAIVSIERMEGEFAVYDIQVHKNHNFVANGVLSRNCLIIDDPHKDREEADSKSARDKVWDWFLSTAYTRLEKQGSIIIIQTRWHEDDMIGRILEGDKRRIEHGKDPEWRYISFPMIAEEDDAFRKKGEPLWPWKRNLEECDRIREQVGSRDWASLYQQRPAPPEGAIFKKEYWNWYDPSLFGKTTPWEHVFQSWDTGVSAREGSARSCCTTWGMGPGGYIYLIDSWKAKVEFPDLKQKAIELARLWRPRHIWVEEQQTGGPLVAELKRNTEIPIRGVRLRGDKVTRAHAVSAMVESGKVKLPIGRPWVQEYIDELASFPAGKYADQVDSTTLALRMLGNIELSESTVSQMRTRSAHAPASIFGR